MWRFIYIKTQPPRLVDTVWDIGFDVHLFNHLQLVGKLSERPQLYVAVVNSRYHRTPHHDTPLRRVQVAQVFKNRRKRTPCQFLASLRVKVLHVVKPEINERLHGLYDLERRIAACLDCRVQPRLFCKPQYLSAELRLRKGFSAGKRETPAGCVVKRLVAQRFLDNLLRRRLPPDRLAV